MDNTRHILITGGAGYIGSALVEALLRRGCWVTVIDKLSFGGESLLPHMPNPAFHFIHGDVRDEGLVGEAVRQAAARGAPSPCALVHLAAIVGFPACQAAGDDLVLDTNVVALKSVFHEADGLGIERFVFSSTYSVYGIAPDGGQVDEGSELYPQSLYAETKIAGEKFLMEKERTSHTAPIIFRFATLYGPSPRMRFDLIINQFVLEAFSKGKLLIFQGDYTRSFVHIQDVLDGLMLVLEAPLGKVRGQIFNLGSHDGNLTKDEIVSLIQTVLPETEVQREALSFGGDMRDVSVSFRRIEDELGYHAKRKVVQGIDEVLSMLRLGLLSNPEDSTYRNAPPIIN
jgi:nucleoside-diphosphate-sugar epimerase